MNQHKNNGIEKIKSIVKEEVLKSLKSYLNEGQINDQNYTHYAILKPIDKIVFGWDYSGYDASELRTDKRYYFIDDMVDNGFNPRDIKILTKNATIKAGLDPDDDTNWDNGTDYME